ncbi:hypothetical protein DFH08DRAFT_951334 [Mycena albidolilacea]|uniref:Uncharacterized protein n=1 Tax=Mycena albidolilacea TaxID=1033008 RepID=A0AAD7F1B6_9AGAR|nr:hypothetical protein DFH08DRAFT_951334 [Mycena albidolilacea]
MAEFPEKSGRPKERARTVDVICACDGEMMMHRNWSVQRCLEATTVPEEPRKIVACMRTAAASSTSRRTAPGNLLRVDPATTLVNKHASHVSNKITELSWTSPAPPIFTYVNKSLKGKYAALACHETGLLVVQRAKDGIVDELLGQGAAVLSEVAKSQRGSCCIQHVLEHRSEKHRQEGGKETLDCVVQRMCEPANGVRRAMIVDLALSLAGSQLIASVLPMADKDQRASLYDCIRGHVARVPDRLDGYLAFVRPSNPIPPLPAPMRALLHDRMRAYYRY